MIKKAHLKINNFCCNFTTQTSELFFKNGEHPTSDFKNCIEQRQLQHPVDNILFIDRMKCKHGFPQAFVQSAVNQTTVNSGMLRLSCPHLVKEIDILEKNGGITMIIYNFRLTHKI